MKTNSEFPEFDVLAKIYMETEWSLADADNTDDIVVSDRFKKKIKRIIFFERSLGILHKVAVVFLCLLIGGGTLIAINEDVRAAVVRFFKETFDTHTEYRDNIYGSDYKYDGMVYEPTWIPDGYDLCYYDIDVDMGIDIQYQKKDKDNTLELFYSCSFLQNSGIGFNTEKTTKYDVLIDGQNLEYYESIEEGYNSCLIWEDGEGRIVYIAGNVDYDTLCAVFLRKQKNNKVFETADDLGLSKDYRFASKRISINEGLTRYTYIDVKKDKVINMETQN